MLNFSDWPSQKSYPQEQPFSEQTAITEGSEVLFVRFLSCFLNFPFCVVAANAHREDKGAFEGSRKMAKLLVLNLISLVLFCHTKSQNEIAHPSQCGAHRRHRGQSSIGTSSTRSPRIGAASGWPSTRTPSSKSCSCTRRSSSFTARMKNAKQAGDRKQREMAWHVCHMWHDMQQNQIAAGFPGQGLSI